MNHRKSVLAALIVGPLLLAGSVWSLQQDEPQARPREARIADRLARHVELSADQQARIETLRKAHRDTRQAFRDEMRKLKDEFRGLRSALKDDPAKAEALIDRMTKLKAERMKAGLRHRMEIDRILTPEQREKLASLRGRIMERRAGRVRGRGRGRGFNRILGCRGWDAPDGL